MEYTCEKSIDRKYRYNKYKTFSLLYLFHVLSLIEDRKLARANGLLMTAIVVIFNDQDTTAKQNHVKKLGKKLSIFTGFLPTPESTDPRVRTPLNPANSRKTAEGLRNKTFVEAVCAY